MEERGTLFHQSLNDFPCPVVLGKSMPSFGLYRFNKALRFIPLDEENFALRGNKQQLLYKGRKRSHRFTILGDTAFEYDCILERPPDSNIVSLLIEGAEHYDFFRQPDFVKNPLLRGSYAVYKKETLLGEGTGKLCHIHRPEIIDARGRRCWGNLAVIGNELRITIPEKWLGEAAYPVLVDPFLGTGTVGSLNQWEPDPGEIDTLYFDCTMPVNRFLASETINGVYTAFFYADKDDREAGCRPVLYTDNGNNPQTRKSREEKFISLRVPNGSYGTWCSNDFKSDGIIASGSYIWFGAFVEYSWFPRFDFGARCYHDFWTDDGIIPNSYPLHSVNGYDDFKLSMFFYYSASQNYIRTITQGVYVGEKRKLKADYKRNAKQTTAIKSSLSLFETFFRRCVLTVHSTMKVSRYSTFMRNVADLLTSATAHFENRFLIRQCADDVDVNSQGRRIFNAFRKAQDGFRGIDSQTFSVLFVRSVPDISMVGDKSGHLGSFIRGLLVNAGSVAETTHEAQYHRFQKDKVQAQGAVFRGLLLFVRIITKVFVRDYILRRFLVAREDLQLKSAICREITLESRLS
jgi:hypothetical protein